MNRGPTLPHDDQQLEEAADVLQAFGRMLEDTYGYVTNVHQAATLWRTVVEAMKARELDLDQPGNHLLDYLEQVRRNK